MGPGCKKVYLVFLENKTRLLGILPQKIVIAEEYVIPGDIVVQVNWRSESIDD